MNKRLFLIFHGRFPSDKAASLFAAKSAEAFAAASGGLKVTVVVPRRRGAEQADPYAYYGVARDFDIEYIPTRDIFSDRVSSHSAARERVAFWVSYISFAYAARRYVRTASHRGDIIYSNELFPLALIASDRPCCIYEMHDFPESKLGIFGYFLRKMRGIIIHNRWKLDEARKLFPDIPEARFLCEPNAVDVAAFDLGLSKAQARHKLSLPLPSVKKIAVYTGHLYGWKGVDTLAHAALLVPSDYLIIFVGGTAPDVAAFKAKYGAQNNIMIVGHVAHADIPLWQKAADVLVLPNTATEKISAYYTSPMKLFEYMASRRPIVASDIPSIREIVSDSSAILVKADDPAALAKGIDASVAIPAQAEATAARAFADVQEHTWSKRAARIVAFIGSLQA